VTDLGRKKGGRKKTGCVGMRFSLKTSDVPFLAARMQKRRV
jgi:hypothetical protein